MRIDHPSPTHVPALRRLWADVFGDTEAYLDLFFSTGYSPENCLLIEDEGAVAAALYWLDMDCPGGRLAYLYAVATAPGHRGKGLCRKLMAKTHETLAQRGYAGAVLVPQGEDLFAMYAKFGYRVSSTLREFTAAATQPITLKPITAADYAAKRRSLLPQAVQLGKRALALLAATGEFYEGEDLLLVCAKNGDTLFCPEYLGDPALAGGVTAALSCRAGRFRSPGGDTPFAMFLPLAPDAPWPGYLGFAFD